MKFNLFEISPRWARFAFNLYGPYLGAGVKLNEIRQDWQQIRVTMGLRWYNRNAVGVQFGGSLFSMVDPHLMIMLMRLLGRDYYVWDRSATIQFLKPAKTPVHCVISLESEDLEEIRRQTANGEKYFPEYTLQITDDHNQTVATVRKMLYIKKKPTNHYANDSADANR